MKIKLDFEGITSAAIRLDDAVRLDHKIRLYANAQLARYCDKFVPASPARIMSQNINITDEYVQYPGPYAHYQYIGVVYGPNIPIMENGTLVGFFSIPNRPKTKTDRKLKYSHDIHPLAQSHWDDAAMVRHKGDLKDDIKDFIKKRYNGGGK